MCAPQPDHAPLPCLPVCPTGLPSAYLRFVDLLREGGITAPLREVLSAITRRCPARLIVVTDCDDAVDLYREAALFPGPSTEGHLLQQRGLRVNGPLFPNPAEGSANLLAATARGGRPVIVKMLAGRVSPGSTEQPGGAEAEACRVLQDKMPAGVPLVPVRIATFKVGPQHSTTAGRGEGQHAVLVMQRYPSSLTAMVPLEAPDVLAGGRRMVAALKWIHKKGYVHMDVKVGV